MNLHFCRQFFWNIFNLGFMGNFHL
jgi:hypothetical protein